MIQKENLRSYSSPYFQDKEFPTQIIINILVTALLEIGSVSTISILQTIKLRLKEVKLAQGYMTGKQQ